jgi:hypothetical protein
MHKFLLITFHGLCSASSTSSGFQCRKGPTRWIEPMLF